MTVSKLEKETAISKKYLECKPKRIVKCSRSFCSFNDYVNVWFPI